MNIRNSKSVHGVNLVSALALAVVLLATSGLGAQEGNSGSQGGPARGDVARAGVGQGLSDGRGAEELSGTGCLR
jgi:hypothetical protein